MTEYSKLDLICLTCIYREDSPNSSTKCARCYDYGNHMDDLEMKKVIVRYLKRQEKKNESR